MNKRLVYDRLLLFIAGLVKLCTFGFFLVGQLVDFLLILLQYVGPADRSDYYVPYYGPVMMQINTTSQSLYQTCA